MQDLIKVFPNYVNTINDWKKYVPEEEKKDYSIYLFIGIGGMGFIFLLYFIV